MRSAVLIAVATTCGLVGALLVGSPASAEELPVLSCPSDTVYFISGGRAFPSQVSALSSPDTSRAITEARVWIAGGVDTLEVPFSLEPYRLWLRSPKAKEPILELVFHHAEQPDREKLALLREHGRFLQTAAQRPPAFRYCSHTDTGLVRLRKEYSLDEVAGSGDDLSRVQRLMSWVHDTVRHDGNQPNPCAMIGERLLHAGMYEGKTCNCRGLSTILNDVYLAMGYPARHLTCLPFDKADPDCHVVNMVYLKSLGKWIYLDPTHDAWFTDRNGTWLGPAEVRAALIAGDSLVVPRTINWNGQPVTRQHYLNYMTKNLYRFSCPVESRPGYEAMSGERAQVVLEPTEYDPEALRASEGKLDPDRMIRWHHTDHADSFWAAPSPD